MDEEDLLVKKDKSKDEPKVEIPVIKAYELLQEMSFNEDDMDVVPKRKQSKFKKFISNKSYKYGMGFAVMLFALFGVSYSFFNYRRIDSRQADISSGEVYVKLVENASSITLSKMYPRTDEEARSRNDNYFDFTVKGKNTSDIKSVLYKISITNGDDVSGKTRINPKYIKLDLQEKINNEYVYIREGINLDRYTFKGTIPINTTSEITKEYRLRIWVNDDVIISDSLPNASYTESEFSNLFATFNISVDADDKQPKKIDSCQDCVFVYKETGYWTAWNTANRTPSVLRSVDYEVDYEDVVMTSGKKYFLGFKLNGSNQIEKAYVCGLHNDITPFCTEGYYDSSKYESNQALLQGENLWNNTCEVIGDLTNGATTCESPAGMVGTGTGTSGYVEIGVDNNGYSYCGVDTEGNAFCIDGTP